MVAGGSGRDSRSAAGTITVQNLLQGFPVALDPARWYFAGGFVPTMIVLALAIYGFRISLGGRPVFAALTAED